MTPDSRRYERAQVIFSAISQAGGGALWLEEAGGWWVDPLLQYTVTTVSFEMLMKYESCVGIFSNRRETFSVIRVYSEPATN